MCARIRPAHDDAHELISKRLRHGHEQIERRNAQHVRRERGDERDERFSLHLLGAFVGDVVRHRAVHQVRRIGNGGDDVDDDLGNEHAEQVPVSSPYASDNLVSPPERAQSAHAERAHERGWDDADDDDLVACVDQLVHAKHGTRAVANVQQDGRMQRDEHAHNAHHQYEPLSDAHGR